MVTEVKLLLENATSVSLPVTPELEKKAQRFKFSTRLYVSLPASTSIEDLKIKFNLNENDKNGIFVWNIMKAWYDLAWNSATGETHTKKELVGSIQINQHSKKGQILRRVTYKNVQLVGIPAIDLDWSETGFIEDLEVSFISDYWEDLYIDN
jgi:hypothetical protein